MEVACPQIYFRSTICFISDEPDWNTVSGTKVLSIWNENTVWNEKKCCQNCSSNREKVLKFEAECQEFAKNWDH